MLLAKWSISIVPQMRAGQALRGKSETLQGVGLIVSASLGIFHAMRDRWKTELRYLCRYLGLEGSYLGADVEK